MSKIIAITPGEPAGIGPDLVCMLAQTPQQSPILILADPNLLQQCAHRLGLPLQLHIVTQSHELQPSPAGTLNVLPIPLLNPTTPGELNKKNSPYVLSCLNRAATGCLQNEFAAVVTGPVHKGIINQAGIPFMGHTEYFANLANVTDVVMMLASDTLRVALVTTHLPLAEVPANITAVRLQRVLLIAHQALQCQFGIAQPRLLVCGLNPHAGEQGHLGQEELQVIIPVLNDLRKQGLHLIGPVAADTAFTPKRLESADVVIAMYHDQGLPVLKYQSFDHAVNVTLGLPFVRTSVDHGTALDLAGTGLADVGSLKAALALAMQLVS